MRTIILLSVLFLITLNSCRDNNSNEEQPDAITIKINSPRITFLGEGPYPDLSQLTITSGNGDYRIVYPKMIEIDGVPVVYSEDIVKITLTDNIIVAERTFGKNGIVTGFFQIIDAKNAKKVFYVTDGGIIGDMFDEDAAERQLLNDPDYWQE